MDVDRGLLLLLLLLRDRLLGLTTATPPRALSLSVALNGESSAAAAAVEKELMRTR